MPCACQLPPEVYPDAAEWGPLLWTVLHGIAERVGTCSVALYRADERRAILGIFQTLSKTIPCPSCKDHYDSYLREHPVDAALKTLPYEELGSYVQRWFWELHNWVNESYKKPTYPFESLRAAYGGVELRRAMAALDAPMQRAIRQRSGQLLAYTDFRKWLLMLLSYYGV